MEEDIIYEFRNIVEESRTEDRQDYYMKLRNTLDLLEKLIEENKELRKFADITLMRSKSKVAEVIKDSVFFEYIPISVIQNKMEKLKREFDFYAGREHFEWQDGEFDGEVCDDIALKIGVLKELLEERNK